MPLTHPLPGQRFVSDNEPELGLGVILAAGGGRVEILFPAAGERRLFALASAPIRRVAFNPGDRIVRHDGVELMVENVLDREGLLVYQTGDGEVPEGELSDTISVNSPEERLLAGKTDPVALFDLRAEALHLKSRIGSSPVRGYIGGRIDLIPHQLSIAGEVASRLRPRVLLADEVGLGKTIEAGLILHRLHLTGRASRALILVPEPLVHQWLVELLRRFNLPFQIFDEERCEAIEAGEPDANPFLDGQLVLCAIGLLSDNPLRASQALEAGWDLLVVDEAHHLEWHRDDASPAYRVVEALAASTPGLLLLTATPQQLGPEGHFARLRLLDPDRYSDLDAFLEEAEHYEAIAGVVDRIISEEPFTEEDRRFFEERSGRIHRSFEEVVGGNREARERLIAELLDSFGTGRVMFRNTRASLTGFPERRAHLARLDGSDEFTTKLKWLAELLRQMPEEKLLLISRTRELAEGIHERLAHEINVKSTLFHEGLTLLQRDKNASYFSDDEGARLLVCSEIGSEGRNFQFAHHLVLFDLPEDPELLEQRIGRLDRIGQSMTVNIHVPYLPGSESETLARWYHEGLNAFEENLHGAGEIARQLSDDLKSVLAAFDEERLAALIDRSRALRQEVAGKLARGYDRLLELNSNKPGRSEELARLIRAADSDRTFESFMIRLLEHFGVRVDEIGRRTYHIRPDQLLTDAFPELPDEGMGVTFDRRLALIREDLRFMTWDHPFARTVIDLLVDSEGGNASYGITRTSGEEGMMLEVYAIVECVAPPVLHVDRFLPPQPVRALIDGKLRDVEEARPLDATTLRDGDIARLFKRNVAAKPLLRVMLDTALQHAREEMERIVTGAKERMERALAEEIERLEELQQINSHVTDEEIESLRTERAALAAAIESARLRVGAIRVIGKG